MAGVTLCSRCVEDHDLKVLVPCHLHLESIKDANAASPRQIHHFLYEETLSGESIRLLRLEPGHDDQPIQCDLVVNSLDNNPVYTALSYTWGDQAIKYELCCGGQPLYIGENLYSALWQIRQDNRADALWVDAICINQKNLTEKTAQVRHMRQIYEAAKLVICWLGTPKASEEDGFALMREIYAQFGAPSFLDLMNRNFEAISDLGLLEPDDRRWKALCRILYRPYFFRIWIVQEIIVARDCIIQCGTHLIDRVIIFAVGAIIEQFHFVKQEVEANIPLTLESTDSTTNVTGAPLLQGVPNTYSVRDLWALKQLVDTGVELKICQLLMNTRMFKATEPRDRIFALIGLCWDVSNTFIDYNKSIEEIQIGIAKLGMLNLQSWGSMIFSYQISLNGTIFDLVTTVVHETPYMTSTLTLRTLRALANHARKMEDWEDSCWDLAAGLDEYPTGQNIFQAYWRALIFNRAGIAQEPTADYEWAYKNWITGHATVKDASLLGLEEASHEPGPQATTIWGKVQGLVNQVSSRWQYAVLWLKVQRRLGLLMKLREGAAPFEAIFRRYACGRKFCVTASGYMGWIPSAARAGDLLCYFEDCQLPFVIRSCEGGYKMVGDSYVHGLMHVRPPGVDAQRQQKIILS